MSLVTPTCTMFYYSQLALCIVLPRGGNRRPEYLLDSLVPPQSTTSVTICPVWSSTSTSEMLARKKGSVRVERRQIFNRESGEVFSRS
jgi:hypothetical protein